jgi:hypothetical protein
MMPPYTTVDLMRTVNQEMARAQAKRERELRHAGIESPASIAEKRQPRISRFMLWIRRDGREPVAATK